MAPTSGADAGEHGCRGVAPYPKEEQEMMKAIVVGLVALALLVAGGGLLGGSSTSPLASHTAAPVLRHGEPMVERSASPRLPHQGPPVERSASPRLPHPRRPPQLQLVQPPGTALALAAGRWAVGYSYADAQSDESAPSPRFILTVPAGMDIRITPVTAPASIDHITYYVSPAVNVLTNLRRYSFGEVMDLIVSGPGTGPIAPIVQGTTRVTPR